MKLDSVAPRPHRDTSPHIKGSAVRELLVWYERKVGKLELHRVVAALPPDVRDTFDLHKEALGVLSSTWYPARPIHALCDVITRNLSPESRWALAREGATAGVDASVRGIYRFVLERIATPERYAQHIQRLWSMLHDTGERSIVIVRPGLAESETASWRGHHPFLCEVTVATMAAMFGKMGCSGVVAERIRCVSDGSPTCRSRVRWSA
jgi:hypothetical protein